MRNDPILAGPVEYTEDGETYKIVVEGGLHYIRGNKAPYFSLTASGYLRYRGAWREDFGGCCHDIILKRFPKFADLAALHLSYINGAPSGDGGNAYYWAVGGQFLGASMWLNAVDRKYLRDDRSDDEILIERIANDLRVSVEDAAAIRAEYRVYGISPEQIKAGKPRFMAMVDTMRPRWKAEADACIAKHGLVVYGDKWEPNA